MILASDIISYLKADLDAEGSDRYLFDEDYKPAINRAILWATSVLESVFNTNKQVAEQLVDLKLTRVFKTSYFSRIGFSEDDLGHEVWNIISVMPNCTTYPTVSSVVTENDVNSVYVSNASFVSATHVASRLTEEEWELGQNNEFIDGNNTLSTNTSLKSYAWIEQSDYSSSGYDPTIKKQIEIRPTMRGLVGVRYIKKPELITAEDSQIEFPASMKTIISDKSLNFISRKQGDGTTEFSVTESDIKNMLSLFV